MTDEKVWTVIAGLAVLTYLTRYSFIGFLAGRRFPPWVTEALGFVPVTVLPALAAPVVFLGADGLAPPAILMGSLATLLTGILARSLFGAFAAGMVVYHLVKLAGG